ncbi:MAG: DUF5719 family protein [Acidimicrobiales bacterium]
MRSPRLTSLVLLGGAIAGGLVLEAADETSSGVDPSAPEVRPGVALPTALPDPTLASTWFCAGGTADADGFADHVLVIANPTDRARTARITVINGAFAEAPSPAATTAETGAAETTTTAAAAEPAATTTTEAPATTTTVRPVPVETELELPALSRLEVRVGDLSAAPLAGAVVEVDGGEIAVEHSVEGELGRATAPCSTTASATWSFPWGVTSRGNRELLVFMNPFPDDATVDIAFATDEGVRDTARFQGFVIPGRSVVGAYVDQDVQRKDQVSAQVQVRGGRLVIDRIQTFDGTDGRQGMTLGLGAPAPAETWIYPMGTTGPGLLEQMVVYNPTDEVAEVEVELRLDAPGEAGPPEPFELTVPPGRYSLIDLSAEERVPQGVGHALIVRSLNGVPVTAERVSSAAEPATHTGIAATLGSPVGASTWYFAGGGPSAERAHDLVLFNISTDDDVTFSVTGFSGGQSAAVPTLQDQVLAPGGRIEIRVGDHIEDEDLSTVVTADGPIVAERGLYAIGGGGMSLAIGIPLADGLVTPDPVEG